MYELLHSTVFCQPVNFSNLLEKTGGKMLTVLSMNFPSVESKEVQFENIYIHFTQLHYYIS